MPEWSTLSWICKSISCKYIGYFKYWKIVFFKVLYIYITKYAWVSLKYIKIFLIKGTCSYHIPIDHTSSACIWNGKKRALFCIPENWLVSASRFHVMHYDVQTILQIKCIGNSLWNLVCFSYCIEGDDSEVYIAGVFKGFDFILCMYLYIYFLLYLKCKNLYFLEVVLILYICFVGFCSSYRYLLRLELLLWWHPSQWCIHSPV